MYTSNLLELGITAIGWEFYNAIVTFAVALNLHLIPFVYMMLRNWWETARSQEAGHAATVELKRTTSDFITMALVVILFWIPNSATTFDPSKYVGSESKERFEQMQVSKNKDDKGSTGLSEVPLPIGWWFVMMGSKAMINQVIDWTSFEPRMAMAIHHVNTMRIENPDTAYQVKAFSETCYAPTLKRWKNEWKLPIPKPVDNEAQNNPAYIGNSLFLNTPGYYKDCAETQDPCYGNAEHMTAKVAERLGVESWKNVTLSNGRTKDVTNTPSCYTWWTGKPDLYYEQSGLGKDFKPLRELLWEEVVNSWGKTKRYFVNTKYDKYKEGTASNHYHQIIVDKNINQLLAKDTSNFGGKDSSGGFLEWLKDTVIAVVAGLGSIAMLLLLQVVITILKPLLFMLQSLAIFGTLISVSITLLIGGFRPQVALKHLGFFVGILMLPLFWHAADYLNEGLLSILYPGFSTTGSVIELYNSSNSGVQAILYFVFIVLAYIMLPGYFVKLMGQAGADAADVASDAMSEVRQGSKSGISNSKRGLGILKGKSKE